MTDEQLYVKNLFSEVLCDLDDHIHSLGHGQELYTKDMLQYFRREKRPDLFGDDMKIETLPKKEREKLLLEIDSEIATDDAGLGLPFQPGDHISPKGLECIMQVYDESFFRHMRTEVAEQINDAEFGFEFCGWVNALIKGWEKMFSILKCKWLRNSCGAYRAQYACKLMNSIFIRRLYGDNLVDFKEYQDKVEAFNYEMADLAEVVRQNGLEEGRLKMEIVASDKHYFDKGRHVIVDVYDEDEIVPWRDEFYEKPGFLYFVKDTKDPSGLRGYARVRKANERNEVEEIRKVYLVGVTKTGGRELYSALHRGGRASSVRKPSFSQKDVGVLCGVTENTVANWERREGGTRPPCGYCKELRIKGGTKFFDFVEEYRRNRGYKDCLNVYLKSRCNYEEGLTESAAGMVEEFLRGEKP